MVMRSYARKKNCIPETIQTGTCLLLKVEMLMVRLKEWETLSSIMPQNVKIVEMTLMSMCLCMRRILYFVNEQPQNCWFLRCKFISIQSWNYFFLSVVDETAFRTNGRQWKQCLLYCIRIRFIYLIDLFDWNSVSINVTLRTFMLLQPSSDCSWNSMQYASART